MVCFGLNIRHVSILQEKESCGALTMPMPSPPDIWRQDQRGHVSQTTRTGAR